MSSNYPGGDPGRRQSIPLQNLDGVSYGSGQQGRSDPFTDAQMAANLPGISTYWEPPPYHAPVQDRISTQAPNAQSRDNTPPRSPIDIDPMAFASALPPGIYMPNEGPPVSSSSSEASLEQAAPYIEDPAAAEYAESDRVPLTSRVGPISGSLSANRSDDRPRDSFQTVPGVGNSPGRNRASARSLGEDLGPGFGASRHQSFGPSLNPNEYRRSRSPTGGALSITGSIIRAMSQRVVNLSGENEIVDNRASRHRSQSPAPLSRTNSHETLASVLVDTSYRSPAANPSVEKTGGAQDFVAETFSRPPLPNPLKGKSLFIFSPNNALRLRLCDLLVNPWIEPFLLVLIVLQTVLLAIEAAHPISADGNHRPEKWSGSVIEWIMLGLFIVFTLELIARIIVSGFMFNAAEYSTIDRQRGIRAAVADQYRAVFQPERQKSVKNKNKNSFHPEPSTLARSFTTFMGGQPALPRSFEEQQRFQLARRAFLRHSFNRIDFVAVVSYWIMFVLSITGLEVKHHIYVFRMMSCLRILRLLSLTNGTAIILRSLKKATPLLVRVAFLLSFFWLLFAIIGVQAFKASFARQCVWLDPQDPTNMSATYTNDEDFCGGYLHNSTGSVMPWVLFQEPDNLEMLRNGTDDGKGYICPRGSICLQQNNPYNGTVNFDNIFNSLELVFVIMSANTFSDLMYNTMRSDYTQAALFFGAGIMIMMLWLTNLLIAVITSSFQVIREESQASTFTVTQDPSAQPEANERPRRVSPVQKIYEKTKLVWVFIITVGLICQACRSATMSQSRENFINIAEVVVTILLDIEMIIRFIGDWNHFHKSWRNIFDLGLAVITSVILIPFIRHTRAYDWLSIFQILRVYRVVMVISVTRELIMLVLGNATGIANLMFFVFLMTFLVAIFASQLFRGELPVHDDDGNLVRISFYQIFNSFLGMYQILSSENWTDILYNVTQYTRPFRTSWIGAMLLIAWFIMAFFILVNMFIAVIQENFDISEDEKRLQQVKAFLQRRDLGAPSSHLALTTIFSFGKTRRHKDPLDYGPATMEMLLKDAVVREFLDDEMEPARGPGGQPRPPQRSKTTLFGNDDKAGWFMTTWEKVARRLTNKEPNPFYSNIRFDGTNETQDPRLMAQQAVSATSARRRAQREYLARYPTYNNSLYVFTPNNPLRRLCQQLVGPSRGPERFDGLEPNRVAWYTFTIIIYACIVAMVVLACVTTPLYQKEYQEQHQFSVRNWYVWTDMAFAIVFTVEAVVKIIADGLLWTPNAFLRSSWGLMDAVVLITLWINVVTLLVNDGAISRAIGAFKALRALRLLNVSNSARNTFHDLIIVGWWKILGAAFVSLSLLIPMAIYGVNLFNGLMYTCNDGSDGINTLGDCFGEYTNAPFDSDWPMLAPRVAANPYYNFDDFASSLFILFQIVSQEGWIDVSFAAQAIVGRNQQPQDLASQGNALFFVAFNLLATVFVLTLFIAVFMRNYTEQTGVAFLTAEQRSWLELRKLLYQISPSKSSYDDSEKSWKKWCHKRAIEKRGKWYQFITIVLVLHTGLLMSEYSSEPDWWTNSRDFIFFSFIIIYVVNIAIRIIGLGWSRFRRSTWNIYSMLIVGGACIATLILFISNTSYELYVQLHKVFFVGIVLLLIPRNDALDQLFKTAAASLTVIGNLLATWLVIFLVFAIAMTQAFSLTRFNNSNTIDMNFRTVPKALILLFKMSLGEGWNEVMEDYASVEPPLCVDGSSFFNSDCGSKNWARFLFIAWNIISMYIFVNLFVSLIYESFSYVYQRSSGVAAVDRDEIRRFKEAWRSVDPAGTGWISKDQFPRLLGELSGAFEMRIYNDNDSIRSILDDVQADSSRSRHMSLVGSNQSTYNSINLEQLNRRIAQLDVEKIRARRRRFNVFYEEVMVSADPDRGIAFTTVLMILAHYNIINDSKSLKLEEFLRRRARLQRVEEQVRRRIVLGFFDTLYWSRKFRQHLQMKQSARMTGVPSLGVPDIYVDDDDHAGEAAPRSPGGLLSRQSTGDGEQHGWLGEEPASHDSSWQHPLSFPRAAPPSPSHHTTMPSAFSFELQEPDVHEHSAAPTAPEPTSATSPTQVRGMLDDTVWVESIRRSASLRRSHPSGQYRYGD